MITPTSISQIPILDHHCHSLFIEQPATVADYTQLFSETYMQDLVQPHAKHSLFYQWGIRALSEFFGCAPTIEAVLAARTAVPLAELTAKMLADANIQMWLVDYGFGMDVLHQHESLKALLPCPVRGILRIEPLVERLIAESPDFDTLVERYRHELKDLRAAGWVSLKSIVAYRTGLQIELTDAQGARGEWAGLKARANRDGKLRLDSKPMLDFIVTEAAKAAHEQKLPFQFHTGFGDPDLDIYKVNPAFMRPLFSDAFRGCQFVLLHASYPYGRTLAYLAAMYPNVYADFGLAIPWIPGEARQFIRELLALAPASKVMYSSDASRVPELFWLGAKLGRRALTDVLNEFIADDFLDDAAAAQWAEMILWGNAQKLYGV